MPTPPKKEIEVEDDEAERLLHPSPKRFPPRGDSRRRRINVPDADTDYVRDPDMKLGSELRILDQVRTMIAATHPAEADKINMVMVSLRQSSDRVTKAVVAAISSDRSPATLLMRRRVVNALYGRE